MRLVQIVAKTEEIKSKLCVTGKSKTKSGCELRKELDKLSEEIEKCEISWLGGKSHESKVNRAKEEIRLLHFRLAESFGGNEGASKTAGDIEQLDGNESSELEDEEEFFESEVGNEEKMARVLQFHEVESVLERFDGLGSGVDWCEQFEANAVQFGWDATLKAIYARRLLDGRAKDWIEGKKIFNYDNLVKEITDEFKVYVNVAETAEKLRSMTRQHGEKAVDYLFRVNKERERAGMDFSALQFYMVRGINVDVATQTAIQKTKTWTEMREHLQSYDVSVAANAEREKGEVRPSASWKVPGNLPAKNNERPSVNVDTKHEPTVRRCFACGESSHLARDCPTKKCFKCKQPGHRSANCPVKPEPEV